MIPVRNLFALLAFAWREIGLIDDDGLGACDFDKPVDVAALLLDHALTRLFRRGLALSSTVLEEAGPLPRGALDIARTVRELRQVRGELACRVNDVSEDTLPNRVIKAAATSLLRHPQVSASSSMRLKRHVYRLQAVGEITAREAARTPVSAPRHERLYVELLWLARLTLALQLADAGAEGDGHRRAHVDDDQLAKLFQDFVTGFARYALRGEAVVNAKGLTFAAAGLSERAKRLLPTMRTDVTIAFGDGGRLLLECKFYRAPLTTSAWSDGERFRIAHLYQVLAYVRAMERTGPTPRATIVYAMTTAPLDESFVLEGVAFRIVAVELGAPWSALRAQMTDIVANVADKTSTPAA